jgi:A/G-specific adenine glycosylase
MYGKLDRSGRKFAQAVIAWQRSHGRHELPWQNTADPYAIWVSEVMLQQTQVATVLPYYARFMLRFPEVSALAASPLEDVLGCWSGLGYYSRARHLHRAARMICEQHGGKVPRRPQDLERLPGIGRSTAAAIAVFAYGGRHAILDGNVKRVLARVHAVEGFPGDAAVAAALWRLAEALLPSRCIKAYTQGVMDLGATVCLPRAPRCGACPVQALCAARRRSLTREIPAPRPHRRRPVRRTAMLILERGGALFLEQRPPTGVWGGLWCFPELAEDADIDELCAARFGVEVDTQPALAPVEHGFTHFHLTIVPRHVRVRREIVRVAESQGSWFALDEVPGAAIPAAVRRLLERLRPPDSA